MSPSAIAVALGVVVYVSQPPIPPADAPLVRPVGDAIPPADAPIQPAVGIVKLASTVDGEEALNKALAESRAACARLRDYAGFLVRQERVNGKLLPEQTAELRVRTKPFSVNLKVVAPKADAGRELSMTPNRWDGKVRLKPAGTPDGPRSFRTLTPDDPKALADTRHPLPDTGLVAVLDRVEKALQVEKRLHNPVQVLASDYQFDGKACTRFEAFADRPHPARFAHRVVLFVDKETKLPVRFEAYDQPRGGGPGEIIEVQSFVGVKANVGLGESAFDR